VQDVYGRQGKGLQQEAKFFSIVISLHQTYISDRSPYRQKSWFTSHKLELAAILLSRVILTGNTLLEVELQVSNRMRSCWR